MPWSIDVEDASVRALPPGHREGWRLFHYLSGGGMRAFASFSTARELVSRRQTRFLWVVSAFAALWIVFRYI